MTRSVTAMCILLTFVIVILPKCLHGRPTIIDMPMMSMCGIMDNRSVKKRSEYALEESNDDSPTLKQFKTLSRLKQEGISYPAKIRRKRQSDQIMADLQTRITIARIAEKNGWKINESFMNNIISRDTTK